MKKYIIGFVCSLIILLFFVGFTVYEVLNIGQLDKKTTSTNIETKCVSNGGEDQMLYDCRINCTYTYNEKEYTCSKTISTNEKKEYKDNRTVYFSSKDPSNCSIDKKANDISYLIIADIVFAITSVIEFVAIKKTR